MLFQHRLVSLLFVEGREVGQGCKMCKTLSQCFADDRSNVAQEVPSFKKIPGKQQTNSYQGEFSRIQALRATFLLRFCQTELGKLNIILFLSRLHAALAVLDPPLGTGSRSSPLAAL